MKMVRIHGPTKRCDKCSQMLTNLFDSLYLKLWTIFVDMGLERGDFTDFMLQLHFQKNDCPQTSCAIEE